jgi:hypothetical protein
LIAVDFAKRRPALVSEHPASDLDPSCHDGPGEAILGEHPHAVGLDRETGAESLGFALDQLDVDHGGAMQTRA